MNLKLYKHNDCLQKELIEDFVETYNRVFNKDGNVVNCGREVCKELIKKANYIGNDEVQYGNEYDGFINLENMQELYNIVK